MAPDIHDHRERIRLPAAEDEHPRYGAAWLAAAPNRIGHDRKNRGIREGRTVANWTVAALIAGVAGTTGYFAHHPATQVAGAAQAAQSGPASSGAAAPGPGSHAAISQPVATSGGSGVTVGSGPAGGGSGGRVSGWRDS